MNNLFQLFNKAGNMGPNNPNMGGFLQRLNEFKKAFSGNPQDVVNQMLKNKKITQAQYDQAVKMTNQIFNSMK